MLSVPLVR